MGLDGEGMSETRIRDAILTDFGDEAANTRKVLESIPPHESKLT